jgi:hypothetical protein
MIRGASAQPQKKKHHYVPVAYLGRFTDEAGYLRVYRKDAPASPLRLKPESTGFRNHYYSQPKPDGGQDNNALEDKFSEVESRWPPLAQKVARGERLTPHDASELFEFMGLQRVRVPAARDMIEAMLAHLVMLEARDMHQRGELPPLPEGHPDLLEKIAVSIDPHKSIHAMTGLMRALAPIFDSIGLEILHNETSVSFITSDNPVAIFDPDVPEKSLRPYVLNPSLKAVETLFPIDPRTMVRGHTSLHPEFARCGPRHRKVRDANAVRRMNRMTARFAYELLIAVDDQHGGLARTYANTSPVLSKRPGDPEGLGRGLLMMDFGARPAKTKWIRPDQANQRPSRDSNGSRN